jgi:hypothetical protein
VKQEPTAEPQGSGGIPVVHGREDVKRHEVARPRARTGHHPARTWADREAAPAGPETGDSLVAAARRIRGFLRAGRSFQAGLAEQQPRLFLTGWSL